MTQRKAFTVQRNLMRKASYNMSTSARKGRASKKVRLRDLKDPVDLLVYCKNLLLERKAQFGRYNLKSRVIVLGKEHNYSSRV